jgi:hypothetical protein
MVAELPAPSARSQPASGQPATGQPATGQRRASVQWIVCVMTTRDVRDGLVDCPFGGPAPLGRCRECRFLEAIESDWHLTDCTTPDE